MALAKLKWVAAIVLSFGVLTAGAGWLALRTTIAAPVLPEKKEADVKLPADPKAVVITFNHIGGGIRRANNDPVMQIQADGTVIVNDPWGLGHGCKSKLTARELQDLLRFVIREKEFFDFDEATAKAAVNNEMQKAGGGRFGIAVNGAPTTIVRVNAGGKEHEAKYYALGTFAGQYPAVKSLGQFRDIEARLMRVQWTAQAGGNDAIAAALKLGNEQLKKEHPKAPALTIDDLNGVRKSPDGKVVISFFRSKINAARDPQTFVVAHIERAAKGEPTVTVKAKLE